MRRIAIIVQRYGAEINGGAELHARQWAQALKPHYAVDVLTSCALDYQTWAPHFPPGESDIDGVRVLRFEHPVRRKVHMPLRHKLRFQCRRWLAAAGLPLVAAPAGIAAYDGIDYLRGKGPTMDGLMAYLEARGADYAALIFFTAFFHPAALGVLVQPQRSLLVPTLHDEKGMYLPHYHRVFRAPRAVLYNTAAEQAVARRLYGDGLAPARVCGVGIPLKTAAELATARSASALAEVAGRLQLGAPFLLYVGRVDRSKGCAELFEHFAALRRQWPTPLKLVVCGQWFMSRPSHPDILATGFVGEADRDVLLAHAAALVVPSRHESLSMVLLEGLGAGCPVIVNRGSEVLREHVRASGIGESYAGAEEFSAAVRRVLTLSPQQRSEIADRGRQYVADGYSWARVVVRLREAIALCADAPDDAGSTAAQRPDTR